jgi:hypothetical protein
LAEIEAACGAGNIYAEDGLIVIRRRLGFRADADGSPPIPGLPPWRAHVLAWAARQVRGIAGGLIQIGGDPATGAVARRLAGPAPGGGDRPDDAPSAIALLHLVDGAASALAPLLSRLAPGGVLLIEGFGLNGRSAWRAEVAAAVATAGLPALLELPTGQGLTLLSSSVPPES